MLRAAGGLSPASEAAPPESSGAAGQACRGQEPHLLEAKPWVWSPTVSALITDSHAGLRPDRRWLSCWAAFSCGGSSRLIPRCCCDPVPATKRPAWGTATTAPRPVSHPGTGAAASQHDLATSSGAEASGPTSIPCLQLTPGTSWAGNRRGALCFVERARGLLGKQP